MRSPVIDPRDGRADDDCLTTGEAAALLGTSRQHVVNLCRSGDLPYTTVGRHRRVQRADVEALRSRTHRMTRDQLRSLWLGHAIAGRLVTDPGQVLDRARRNVGVMQAAAARGSSRVWLQEWAKLLDGPIENVLEALTSRAPRARELRQNSPFAGVLTDDERRQVLRRFGEPSHLDTVS
jgi:excisionase family DNA binding protein